MGEHLILNVETVDRVLALLASWEKWEASIITDNDCWAPDGMADTPRLQQYHMDELTALQTERNAIKAALSSKVSP